MIFIDFYKTLAGSKKRRKTGPKAAGKKRKNTAPKNPRDKKKIKVEAKIKHEKPDPDIKEEDK